MKAVRRPNLFIVGAPKCGTTALYYYLRNHPEVFMSRVKEPQFFAADIFAHQRNVLTQSEYLDCFARANGAKKIGEASTGYLGSRVAARDIKAFSPSAQVIIMLRNPVDVMYAQHSERVFSNMEHIRDFPAAVDSTEERRWRSGAFKGERVARLGYRELARFSPATKRYFDIFGRENVHVVIYDDLRRDAGAAYREVLRFLKVDLNHEPQCSIINANRRARSLAVQRFLEHPPKLLWRISEALLSKHLRSSIGRSMRWLNVVYAPRPPMNEKLRQRLQAECRFDIEQLSCLLDRDLSHWCEGPRFPRLAVAPPAPPIDPSARRNI